MKFPAGVDRIWPDSRHSFFLTQDGLITRCDGRGHCLETLELSAATEAERQAVEKFFQQAPGEQNIHVKITDDTDIDSDMGKYSSFQLTGESEADFKKRMRPDLGDDSKYVNYDR